MRMILFKLHEIFFKLHLIIPSQLVEYYILKKTVLFNSEYYTSQREDLKTRCNNPLMHFIRHGWKENLSPCQFFDVPYYLKRYNDVAQVGMNPLIHYMFYGSREFRNPNVIFDTLFYKKMYMDFINSNELPLSNYIRIGAKKGFMPSSKFLGVKFTVGDSIFIDPEGEVLLENPSYLEKIKQSLKNNNFQEAVKLYTSVIGDNSSEITTTCIVKPLSEEGKTVFTLSQDCLKKLRGYHSDLYYPKMYIKRLEDVELIGGSRSILKGDCLLNDELYEFCSPDYGIKKWQIMERMPKSKDNRNILLSGVKRSTRNNINKGILIACDHDNNYFHWLDESLPMVLFALAHNEFYRDYPLLIPAELHPNFKRALHLILQKLGVNLEVFELKTNEIYKVRDLIVPSDLSRILDRYHGQEKNGTDIVLNPKYIQEVRRLLCANINNAHGTRKLYLTRRSGTYRKLLNETEIELYLLHHGFEIVDLAKVSFEYQQELFSQAKIIVAPTGATMTNMLLAPEETTFVVLLSDHPQALPQMYNGRNVDVWQQLADICSINLIECNGKRAYNREDLHDDFEVKIDSLGKILSRILGDEYK